MKLHLGSKPLWRRLAVALAVVTIAWPMASAQDGRFDPSTNAGPPRNGGKEWQKDMQRLLTDPKGPVQALCKQHFSRSCTVHEGTGVPVVKINPDEPAIFVIGPPRSVPDRSTGVSTSTTDACQACCLNKEPKDCLAKTAGCNSNYCVKPSAKGFGQ